MKAYLIVAAVILTHAARAAEVTIEADNGAIYKVDMGAIKYQTLENGFGGIWSRAETSVRIVQGDEYIPKYFYFDCRGHFVDADTMGGFPQYAPPRSVIGRISALVCAKLSTRPADHPRSDASR